jgi:adenylate cyclase
MSALALRGDTEADTGASLWAERYDRALGDILALQDEIAEEVAGAIEPELLKKQGQRGAERAQSFTAWVSSRTL